MPKQKTRKSILKRFKVTGTGKVMRNQQNARHRRLYKSASRKRRFGKSKQTTVQQAKIIKSLINR